MQIFTVRNEVAKVIFLHLSVILFTGGSASVHAGYHIPPKQAPPRTRHPTDQAPPGTRHPLDQAPPQEQAPPQDQVPPPQDQAPPRTRHTPSRAEMATAADGTHPTGMHSCFHMVLEKSDSIF